MRNLHLNTLEALDEPNVDQQFSAKKLDDQLEMEELFAVDTLCLMIDFDIPKEQMHNQLPTEPMIPEATVQGCNNLETAQSIITKYESHAIHDHLDNLSMKNTDFVQGSNDAKLYFPVDVNPTVAVNSLRVPLERYHKVSRYLQDPYIIQPDSTEPNHKVRARHKKIKKRCMPLTTPDGKLIPAWTEVYWGSTKKGVIGCLIRPAEADWAIAGPFFNTFMLGYELPCYYADGVTYGVPWFAQFVEKIIILAILSLPPDDLTVEYQKWWLDMRACYATQIPKLLLKTEVLYKKNIDPANYSITYRYAVNVTRQGDAYGDCGIWVIRNMYRLVNNLSLDVSNPTQLGLAYQERLTDFFWKYKIPVKQFPVKQ
ncbi:hypothetical protein Tco_0032071 [Tanacetum coccineum]